MENTKHELFLKLSYETNEDSYKGHGDAEEAMIYSIETEIEIGLVDDGVIENFKVNKFDKSKILTDFQNWKVDNDIKNLKPDEIVKMFLENVN